MKNNGVMFLGVITALSVGVFVYAIMRAGATVSDAPDRSAPYPADVVEFASNLNALTPIQPVPEYTLMNHKGDAFQMSSMSGKVWAVDFFFTSCPSQCPMITTNMAHLFDQFKADKRFEVMSISVDPSNDTAEKLAAYATRFNVDTDRWHFLRSDQATLMDIATNGLRLGTAEDPTLHRSHFILVDEQMWIRGYYDGADTNRLTEMARDIGVMLSAGKE